MNLSIIIVNWNSADFLLQALRSVQEHIREVSNEVIVVDNASKATELEKLSVVEQQFPQIKVIHSEANLGFARANNLGFQHSTGEWLLFLNPDTELLGLAISKILEQARQLHNVGIVGCKLLNTDHSVQLSSVQSFPTILNQVLDIEFLQLRWPHWKLWGISPLFSNDAEPQRVNVISGACMLLKREVFEKVGMFSEDYFMYAEDLDLCYKTQRLGLNNYYVGGATIIHHGGKSSSQRAANQWSVMMKFNSIFKFCVKTGGRFYGLLYRLAMVLSATLRLLALTLMSAFNFVTGNPTSFVYARTKWISVLKWSVGLNNLISADK